MQYIGFDIYDHTGHRQGVLEQVDLGGMIKLPLEFGSSSIGLTIITHEQYRAFRKEHGEGTIKIDPPTGSREADNGPGADPATTDPVTDPAPQV